MASPYCYFRTPLKTAANTASSNDIVIIAGIEASVHFRIKAIMDKKGMSKSVTTTRASEPVDDCIVATPGLGFLQ